MADFAPAGAAQEAHLTHAERGEVVVEHEAFEGFALQHIQALLIFAGSQRGRNQRLRLAAGKQRGAVRAGQKSDFGSDGAHLVKGALVRPLPLLQDVIAEQPLFHFVNKLAPPACAWANRLRDRWRSEPCAVRKSCDGFPA